MQIQAFQQLLSLLYESVMDGGPPSAFLRQLTRVSGGTSAMWLCPGTGGLAVTSFYNKTPEFVSRYQELLLHRDCSLRYSMAHRGKAYYTEDLFRARPAMRDSDVEGDACMDEARYRISGGFVTSSGEIGAIAVHRGARSGAFSRPHIAKYTIESVLPHIEQTLRVAAAVGFASAQTHALGQLLANRHQVFITFDIEGRILGIQPDHVPVLLGEKVVIHDFGPEFAERRYSEYYRALLARVIAAGRCENDSGGGAFVVPGAGLSTPSIRICAMPYRADIGVPGRVCAVVVIAADALPHLNPDLIAKLYSLGTTESHVASLLVQGLDVRGIANSMMLTEQEVREHVGTSLKKCYVKGQLELARLFASGPLGHLP